MARRGVAVARSPDGGTTAEKAIVGREVFLPFTLESTVSPLYGDERRFGRH